MFIIYTGSVTTQSQQAGALGFLTVRRVTWLSGFASVTVDTYPLDRILLGSGKFPFFSCREISMSHLGT